MSVLLLAEDDEDIAAILIRVFQRAGLTVVRTRDGRAAYELAVANPPDVVVTDVGMPAMDGWALTRAIRDHPLLADIPVAILSGHLSPGDPRPAAAGACAMLLKPCPNEQLIDTGNKLLALGRHGHTAAATPCLELHLVPA